MESKPNRPGNVMDFFRNRRVWLPASIFFVVYVIHFGSGVIASGDSRWCIYTAESILRQGNTNLDEYSADLKANDYYWVERIDGHYYTRFPLGASLVALPFVFILDHAFHIAFTLFPGLQGYMIRHCSKPLTAITVTSIHWRVELVVACFVIALASVFIYFIAREFLREKGALFITFIFAFCTSAWSTGSRSMDEHGPSMLFLAIALYLFVLARRRPALIQYASLPLAFSYVVRPTNSIPIFVLTVCVLIEYRRYFVRYALWSLLVSIPFFLYNFHIYHAPLSRYYSPHQLGNTHHFFEALAGTVISPSRGLLVFTPVFFLVALGIADKIRARQMSPWEYGLILVFFLHWVAIASFRDWWGGHSYGPRYFSDLTPFFVYFLIPVVARFEAPDAPPGAALRWSLAILVAFSFFTNARGATDLRTWGWNREPVDVNAAPQRLWDWRDPQFMRDLFK